MTRAAPVGEPLLAWSRIAVSAAAPSEETAIGVDGVVWLWVRDPMDSQRRDVVGTWKARSTEAQLGAARRLAAEFARDAASLRPPDAHAAGLVDVVADGVSRRLAPGRETGIAREILALGDELSAVALTAPLSVARLAVAVNPSIDLTTVPGLDPSMLPPELVVPTGGGIIIRVVVSSDGSEPVSLSLEPNGLQVHWLADNETLSWVEVPTLEHGLIGDGEYVDGLRTPAGLRPGASAAAIAGTLQPPAGATGLRLRASGLIQLVGPWDGLDIPTDRFEAMSAPITLVR